MVAHKINIKIDDLTEDQKIIYNSILELGTNISIEGGPGTGKTMLLFLLAEKTQNLGIDYRIVTNQNNLKKFLKFSFGNISESNILNAWGTNSTKEKDREGIMYKIADYVGNPFPNDFFAKNHTIEKRKIFFNDLLTKVKENKNLKDIYKKMFIFIDEAQDLPIEYFKIIKEIFGTVIISGDDNQNIYDEIGGSFNEIKKILEINKNKQYFLSQNFRNSIQIYNFAKLTGFEEKDLDVINKSLKVEIIKGFQEKEEINKIKSIIDGNIGSNIAIITNRQTQDKYNIGGVQILSSSKNSNSKYIDMEKYDNFCFNFKNNKGLEFDVVIITGFDKKLFFSKDMYVAITRSGYNKNTRNGWKLYIFSNDIENYLDLKNNENIRITSLDKVNKEEENDDNTDIVL